MTPALSVEGVVHVYRPGDVRALDGVDLVVQPGERVALIGQNGSGKSTLARHLNGLLRPTAGRVVIEGADAAGRTVAQLARSVALTFQDPDRQIFAGSVRAEVEFGPRNVGLAGAALRAAVSEALEAVGLAGVDGENPYDLGPSRRRLLAIASAVAMRTPLVVLDEPTTGQDERGVQRLGALVERLAGEGRTVVAISHDVRFAAERFSRVVVLRAGRIVLDGPPGEVFSAASWDALGSSHLEPPLAARVGHRLGLGSTPNDVALIAAMRGRSAVPRR